MGEPASVPRRMSSLGINDFPASMTVHAGSDVYVGHCNSYQIGRVLEIAQKAATDKRTIMLPHTGIYTCCYNRGSGNPTSHDRALQAGRSRIWVHGAPTERLSGTRGGLVRRKISAEGRLCGCTCSAGTGRMPNQDLAITDPAKRNRTYLPLSRDETASPCFRAPATRRDHVLRRINTAYGCAYIIRTRKPDGASLLSPSATSLDGRHVWRQVQARGGNRQRRLRCVARPRDDPVSSPTGSVFLGVHTIAGKEVAIKLEPAIPRSLTSPLRQESKVYKSLMGGPGVPWIMYSGKQGDYNVMVIDLLGPSLEDLFKVCNRHFTLKTVLLLADQLVCLFSSAPLYQILIIISPRCIHVHFPLLSYPALSLFIPAHLYTAT